jgi:hypothetical protein
MKRIIQLSLSFCLLAMVTGSQVRAQEVFEKPLLTTQIADVRATYRSQLEAYRTAERQYLLTKEQFLKLNTLASLEEAVKATRAAMVARDQVLTSYLTLLRLTLIDATGVNLTQKEPTLVELDAVLVSLATHTQTVTAASDRYQLTQAAQEYVTLGPKIEAVAYQTLSILSIGELQTVYDKSLVLNQEIETELSSKTDVKSAERQRALTEIKRELSEVQAAFTEANELVEKEQRKFTQSFYNRLGKNLGSVYVGLSQTLTHMAEVLKL